MFKNKFKKKMEYNTSLMNSSNKKSNYSYFNTEIGGEI